MPVICKTPGCGYSLPEGQKAHNKCPNCDENPFSTFNKHTGKPHTYTKDELKGRRIFLQKAAR